MSLALSDFKKTSRTTDAGRQLYPYQIKDDRYLASISYAINYYEQMLGRRRREIEAATLIEFFGDPKLARGLVACLHRTYRWHQQQFGEVLERDVWQALRERQLATPADLRRLLYRHANTAHNGFVLPAERGAALEAICADLPITPQQFEFLLHLDDEGAALLVRSGPTPEAADIVAMYNFHSLETPLRHVKTLRLRVGGEVWAMLLSVRNLARRYKLNYDITEGPRDLFGQQFVVTWHGRKDALGSWSRHGRKIVRAMLRLLAAHPDAALDGEAEVVLQGRTALVKLDARALKNFGVQVRNEGVGDEAWATELDDALATAWSRAYSRRETYGWRLRRDPEPLALEGGVFVPDFVALRGPQRMPVFVPATIAGAEALAQPLDDQKVALVVVPHEARAAFKQRNVPLVTYTDAPDVAAIARALHQHFPAAELHQPLSRWDRLAALLAADGFVPDAQLPELLGCRAAEVAATLRGWGDNTTQYVPGLGLCTPAKLRELSQMLQRAA